MNNDRKQLRLHQITRDLWRARAQQNRARKAELKALASFALMTGQLGRFCSLELRAESHRLADERMSKVADYHNRRACVIRKRIK